MKKFLFFLVFIAVKQLTQAQAPQKFSFQGVARNADGKMLANNVVHLRLTIHSESPAGTVKYQESHSVQTNGAGIFNVLVGNGNLLAGNWNLLDWKEYSYYLQVELDVTGGNNFVDVGTTQLISVPYSLYSAESARWQNGYPVVQRMEMSPDIDISQINDINDPRLKPYLPPSLSEGATLLWYPLKGAFRSGNAGAGAWDLNNLGDFSVAFGSKSVASGIASTALGFETQASGFISLSTGFKTVASGSRSTAMGDNSNAVGTFSTAIGRNVFAKASGSVTIGLYNDVSDDPDPVDEAPTDRIFQVGIGASGNRRNAQTILRSGNVGIGSNVLNPQYVLDIGSRARIRHNGSTAGIYFNNSQNIPDGFVGMMNDSEIGFYLSGWKFYVQQNGNATLTGILNQQSDLRLKKEISPLTLSLRNLRQLNGYHYHWKDTSRDRLLQTGLIAQEVEKLFPELVNTDEKDMKSVNYIGLIPHLIEAIKEQSKQIDNLQQQLEDLKEKK